MPWIKSLPAATSNLDTEAALRPPLHSVSRRTSMSIINSPFFKSTFRNMSVRVSMLKSRIGSASESSEKKTTS